jgi:hypothetical protein
MWTWFTGPHDGQCGQIISCSRVQLSASNRRWSCGTFNVIVRPGLPCPPSEQKASIMAERQCIADDEWDRSKHAVEEPNVEFGPSQYGIRPKFTPRFHDETLHVIEGEAV